MVNLHHHQLRNRASIPTADPTPINPLLAFQPAFTYSMPTQLIVHGAVLTLLTVLILHLLFTAKYHYPLARLNFVLLVSAVILTQISTIIVVVVINQHLFNRSRFWPFMFDYVEVTMPPPDWKTIPLAGWYTMQGAVTCLAHATHIQFLTLLFPSSLEKKLIISFLGPLCLFSSLLFFTHFLQDPNLQDLGDAVRNTATSTLSLLYTFGLSIWGYAVNRKRAWEHEGGTFGFGVLSITLSLAGTAANFIEVKEDRLKWLPWLVNTVLLWQSWAGFWWWVGAGMWSGEVEDIEQREKKKIRNNERRRKRTAKLINSLITQRPGNSPASCTQSSNGIPDLDVRSATALNSRPANIGLGASSRTSENVWPRARSSCSQNDVRQVQDGHIELNVLSSSLTTDPSHLANAAHNTPQAVQPNLNTALTPPPSSSTNGTSQTGEQGGLFSILSQPACVQRWIGTLSEAHNAAAKQQARAAGGIKQTEQVKKWGIWAMTQRVTLERIRQTAVNRPIPQHKIRGVNGTPNSSSRKVKKYTSLAGWSTSRKRCNDSDWISDEDEPPQLVVQMMPPGSRADLHLRRNRQHESIREQPTRSLGINGTGSRQGARFESPSPAPCTITAGGTVLTGTNITPGARSNEQAKKQQIDILRNDREENQHGWKQWKKPFRNARLRDVTNYD